MNTKPLICSLCLGVIPFIVTLIKLRRNQKKFELKEKIYRKLFEKQLEQEKKQKQEENEQLQKSLQSQDELVYNIENTLLESLLSSNQPRVRKICITGGPCAGKTTGLTYLQEKLQERGFAVFLVPEAATTLFMGGGMLDLDNYSQEGKQRFQINLMALQVKLEQTFAILALLCPSNKTPVLLCDRGLMDGKAYMESNDWYRMIGKYNLNEWDLRDSRYDAIIHMVTAADNTDCYSILNNKARHETKEQAIEMDRRTQKAWVGHPKYIKLDNHTIKSFEEKLYWLLSEVLQILSYPLETKAKDTKYLYVISYIHIDKIKYDFQTFEIKKYYLIPRQENSTLKIIKRIQNGRVMHFVKEKLYEKNTSRILKINLKVIRKNEFEEYKKFIDPQIGDLDLKRSCFLYEGQYMVIDYYPKIDLFTLMVKNPQDQAEIQFPPFVTIEQGPVLNVKVNGRRVADKINNGGLTEEKTDVIKMYFRKLSHDDDSTPLEPKKQQQKDIPHFQLDQQTQSPIVQNKQE